MNTAIRKPAPADADWNNRPGVPMEAQPHALVGVHWSSPERQEPHSVIFKRVGLDELTPVFGTAQPPRGLSGVLRKAAYDIPEHKAAHWALLLFADRVDVAEGLVKDAFTRKPYYGIWAVIGGIGFIAYTQMNGQISKRRNYGKE